MDEITVALEQEKQDLLARAKQLGFVQAESKSESESGWIVLSKLDTPFFRFQFQISDEGLDQLGQFLQEHGNWSAQATNKAGDTIHLSIDRENKYYKVVCLGLVGYDSVDFHVGTEEQARTLYDALLAVEQVEAD